MVCICAIWSIPFLAEVHHAALFGEPTSSVCQPELVADANLDQETDLETQVRGKRGRERDKQTRGTSAVGGFAVDCGLWTVDWPGRISSTHQLAPSRQD